MSIAITTILLFILSIIITSIVTAAFINYKHKKIAATHGCPFKNACIHYDDIETKNAAHRVAKLLLENSELEIEYKKSIRQFLNNSSPQK